jgi:hypothetical protein
MEIAKHIKHPITRRMNLSGVSVRGWAVRNGFYAPTVFAIIQQNERRDYKGTNGERAREIKQALMRDGFACASDWISRSKIPPR